MKLHQAKLTCAGCGSKMQVFHVGEVEVDRCDYCGGLWLDAGEASRIVKTRLLLKRSKRPSQRQCPRCQTPLLHARLVEVPVEHCGTCKGTYLDHGELEQVAHHPVHLERRGPQKAPSFECPGCRKTVRVEEGHRTQWGLACHVCAPTLSFGTPADLSAQPVPAAAAAGLGPQGDPGTDLGLLGVLLGQSSNQGTGRGRARGVLPAGLVVGVVLLIVGVGPYLKRLGMSERATATGRVVELKEKYTPLQRGYRRDSHGVQPIVQFSTPNGGVYTFGTGVYTRPPSFSLGDTVEVVYDPRDPTNATISAASDPVPPLALAGGVLALLGSAVWLVYSQRAYRGVSPQALTEEELTRPQEPADKESGAR